MKRLVPYGEIQGRTPNGIAAFSNKSDNHFSGERNFVGIVPTGLRWQCVEFARRWLLLSMGLLMPEVAWACHLIRLSHVTRISDGATVPAVPRRNGRNFRPEANSLLIFPSMDGNIVGHVAVITEVGDGWVRIADQNQTFHHWDGPFAQELKVTCVDGCYTIVAVDHDDPDVPWIPLGWVTFPEAEVRDPAAPLDVYRGYTPPAIDPCELVSHSFHVDAAPSTWLDVEASAMDRAFSRSNAAFTALPSLGATVPYVLMNIELWFNLVRTGHAIFNALVQAAAEAVGSDALLTRCGVPSDLWSLVRHSLQTNPHTLLTRVDLTFDGTALRWRGLCSVPPHVYNCATYPARYAEAIGLDKDTRGSGMMMGSRMEAAWKLFGISRGTVVHFLSDGTAASDCQALLLMGAAAASGVRCAMITLNDLAFAANGAVVDKNGDEVSVVWHGCAWADVFRERAEATCSRPSSWAAAPTETVRLHDVLLNTAVTTIEPLWKCVLECADVVDMARSNATVESATVADARPDAPVLEAWIVGEEYSGTSLRTADGAWRPLRVKLPPTFHMTRITHELLDDEESADAASAQ